MLCIVLLFFGFAIINPIFNKKTYKIYLLLFAVALACLAWFTKPDYTMDLYRAYGQLDLFRQISFGKAYQHDNGGAGEAQPEHCPNGCTEPLQSVQF